MHTVQPIVLSVGLVLLALAVAPSAHAQGKLADNAFAAAVCEAWNSSALPYRLGTEMERKFRGKTMEVRKFQRRSSPDRRDFLPDIGWRSATSKERRNRERRRANIQSSLGKAARIHGIDGL